MSDAVPRGAMPPEHRNGTGVAAEEIVRLALEAVADRLDDLEEAVVGRTADPPSAPATIDLDALAERVAARLEPALAASRRASAEALQSVQRSGRDLAAGLDGLARRVADLEQRLADDVAARPSLSADEVAASIADRLAADRELSEAWDQRVAAALSGHLEELRGAIASRLDGLEHGVAERLTAVEQAAASASEQEGIAEALAGLTARLAVVDERLSGVERAVAVGPVDRTDEVEALVEETAAGLGERIAAVERAVRAVEVPDPAVAVRASLAPLADGIDRLREAIGQRQEVAGGADAALLRPEIDAALGPISERVDALASADALTALSEEVRDRLDEIAGAVEGRGDTARLIALLEERMSAVLRAVALRADASRSSIEELGARLERDEKAAADVARAVRQLSGALDGVPAAAAEAASEKVAGRVRTVGDRLDQLDERAARLEGLLGALRADLDAVLVVRADVAALDRALGAVSADIAEMRLVADAWSAGRQRT